MLFRDSRPDPGFSIRPLEYIPEYSPDESLAGSFHASTPGDLAFL